MRVGQLSTEIDRMAKTWSHCLARVLVHPLVRTPITPNHITALRAVSGAVACVGFAWGSREAEIWGGVAWVLSALLDRADGELARLTSGRARPAICTIALPIR